ncbi:hypothetical protein SADUNF_SadunfUnG0011300 [Salix dunnii]|uniref:ATG1a/b/c MIT domain-containing protein n=1 Tax=Salix dunnii TaxID=1413687 RepID=A0A835J476_9ROSI|nr:hypothetical protein SADUNF_SadunfUnG0011300 [Salix dunnii]
MSRRRSSRSVDGFPFSESSPGKNVDDNSQEDCLSFLLDDDSSGQEGSPFVSKRMSPMKSTYGFSVNSRDGGRDATSNVLNDVNFTSRYISEPELKSCGFTGVDRSSLEIPGFAPGTSEGSVDLGDAFEQPSTLCVTRIKSFQQCASAIAELVLEKMKENRLLEAFSIQLVILVIWKQALHICHTQATSAIEGSPSQESSRLKRRSIKKHGTPDTKDCLDVGPENMSIEIEGEFLQEVERAEELSKAIEPGSTEMPDVMETIFQSALSLGRHGGSSLQGG